jgi:thiamine pyrophosphokinase
MKRLNFTQKPLDCILILQGKAPDPEIFRFFQDTFLIATDGAANGLIELGIIPHIIIGDLDSFDSSLLPENAHSQIIQIVDQEKNDFEKALDYCLEKNLLDIAIFGIHGGDFEHSLNNVSVLWKYVEHFSNMTIIDSRSRIAIPVFFDMMSDELFPQEIISLIPFPHARLSTQGLQWNLLDEVLELSKREGARNSSLGNSIQIQNHEGRFLFFCNSRLPALPLFTNYPS